MFRLLNCYIYNTVRDATEILSKISEINLTTSMVLRAKHLRLLHTEQLLSHPRMKMIRYIHTRDEFEAKSQVCALREQNVLFYKVQPLMLHSKRNLKDGNRRQHPLNISRKLRQALYDVINLKFV